MKLFGLAPDPQPPFAQDLVVASQKEMHFPTEERQLPTVIQPDRAGPDDRRPEIGQDMTRAHLNRQTTLASIFCSLGSGSLLGLEVARDQARTLVESQVSPGPLEKDGDPVAKADQVKDVNE